MFIQPKMLLGQYYYQQQFWWYDPLVLLQKTWVFISYLPMPYNFNISNSKLVYPSHIDSFIMSNEVCARSSHSEGCFSGSAGKFNLPQSQNFYLNIINVQRLTLRFPSRKMEFSHLRSIMWSSWLLLPWNSKTDSLAEITSRQ